MLTLARGYGQSDGSPKDDADAADCFGTRLQDGIGVERNVDEAARYFRISADAGCYNG
jgi:TPR repeat protein